MPAHAVTLWPDSPRDAAAPNDAISRRTAYGVKPAAGGYTVADLSCAPGPHRREYHGIYGEIAVALVLSGAFEYRSEGRTDTAVPGTLLFANRGEAFSCRHLLREGNRRIVLFLSGALIESVAEDLCLESPRFRAALAPPSALTPSVTGLLYSIARSIDDEGETAAAVARASLEQFPDGSLRERVPPRDVRRILEVVRYVNAEFASACSLDTLASIAGMTRFRFARRFREVTGETANRYVANRRLAAAATQLAATGRPISEIAYAVGFNDLSWFNARFRQAFGCAPGAWRRGRAGR